MSIKEIAQWTGGGLFIILTLIQIAPIKINLFNNDSIFKYMCQL